MVVLLELSEEVLSLIISRLANNIDPLANEIPRPASNSFGDAASLMPSIFDHRKTQICDLHALLLTCRVFRRLVTPFLYLHINVLNRKSLCLLMRTLENDKSYRSYIKVATIVGVDEAIELFFLPKIMEVDLWDSSPWHLGYMSKSMFGQSPVTVMRFANCTLDYLSVEYLLKFPRALEELWYEVGRLDWRSVATIHTLHDMVNEMLLDALIYQKKHLRKFTLTVRSDHCSGYPGTRIDLSEFQTLKHLRIDEIFLTFSPNDKVSMSLPKCLEVLEVVNEGNSCSDFGYRRFERHLGKELKWICEGNHREGLRLKKVLYENRGTGLRGCDYDFVEDAFRHGIGKNMLASIEKAFQENGMELTIRLNCYDPYCSAPYFPVEIEYE